MHNPWLRFHILCTKIHSNSAQTTVTIFGITFENVAVLTLQIFNSLVWVHISACAVMMTMRMLMMMMMISVWSTKSTPASNILQYDVIMKISNDPQKAIKMWAIKCIKQKLKKNWTIIVILWCRQQARGESVPHKNRVENKWISSRGCRHVGILVLILTIDLWKVIMSMPDRKYTELFVLAIIDNTHLQRASPGLQW